jgi:alcohol dehydrogenase (cytochrome c)
MRIGTRGRARRIALAATVLMIVLIATVVGVPGLRLRVQLVLLHAAGRIPDVDSTELLAFMKPDSTVSLVQLAKSRNPYAVVENSRTTAADVEAGRQLFRSHCAACHAPDGSGGTAAPALFGRAFKVGDSDWAIYRTIQRGIPGTAMPRHALPQTSAWQLVAFVRSIDRPGHAPREERVGAVVASDVRLTYDELASIRTPADEWLTYSGSYSSSRHSTLSQLEPGNVGQLSVRWMHQFDGEPQPIQASPLVRKGVMFTTTPPGRVFALDAATGKPMWSYNHPMSGPVRGSEYGSPSNRGVALLDDKVFVATLDARLVALSMATGAVQWKAEVATDLERYFITGAPLAYRDLIVTGVSNRRGGRGFIAAYDARTGQPRWRFDAIPGPGVRGNETWAGDSWREGGGPTWLTGSYDPELDLLIWGIGNPKPDYDADARRGDNLYTNSVVALRGATGELVWHFQFTPADDHDWDSCQIPVLADRPAPAGTERLVLWANRNGFYYVLNRESGKFLRATPFAHQTWTDGIDANGRPKPLTGSSIGLQGSLSYPGNVGATNWWSPSFDPARNLMFVPVLEQGMVYFRSSATWPTGTSRSFYTAIRALDASNGSLVWEHRRPPRLVDAGKMGGLLSTTTGLVFGGDQNTFFALDARTGEPLWSLETGARILAAPVTYMSNGEQFVAITAGRTLLVLSLPRRTARSVR